VRSLNIPKKEHDQLVLQAISLVKIREESKWEICKIALRVCYINDKKGGCYKNKYSITDFAKDIGVNRKTLSCWCLDYQVVAKRLQLNTENMEYSEIKKMNSAIQKTRMEIVNLNETSRSDLELIPKETIQETYDFFINEDELSSRLKSFIKDLKHHKYTFKNSKLQARHNKLIREYIRLNSEIGILAKEIK
jgi:hypothetical protein